MNQRVLLGAGYLAPLLGEAVYLAALVPVDATRWVIATYAAGGIVAVVVWFALGRSSVRFLPLHLLAASVLAGLAEMIGPITRIAHPQRELLASFLAFGGLWLLVLLVASAQGVAVSGWLDGAPPGPSRRGLVRMLSGIRVLQAASIGVMHGLWLQTWIAHGSMPYKPRFALTGWASDVFGALEPVLLLATVSTVVTAAPALLALGLLLVLRRRLERNVSDQVALAIAAAAPLLVLWDPLGALGWFFN